MTRILAAMAAIGPMPSHADMQVLVAPRCDKSIALLEQMPQSIFERVRFVPCSLREADDGLVEEVLKAGDRRAALRRFMSADMDPPVLHHLGPGRRQRQLFDDLGRVLFVSTGRPPATPTIVVRDGEFERLYRGAPRDEDFARIVAWAASRRHDPWISHPALFPE